MPNVARVLKDETTRLARKEVRSLVVPLKKDASRAKRAVVQLKREVAQLKRQNEWLLAAEKRRQANVAAVSAVEETPAAGGRRQMTAKGVRSLRRRLGLSQRELGLLLGVSWMSVFSWEKKNGVLNLRQHTRAALASLKGMGAREARRRLDLQQSKRG